MKRTIFFIITAVVAFAMSFCASAQTVFSALDKNDGVDHVKVTKFMLSLAGAKSLSGAPVTKDSKLDQLDIYNCDTRASIAKLDKLMTQFLAENPTAEELVSVDEKGEETKILGLPIGDTTPPTLSLMLIYNKERDSASLILIQGKIQIDPKKLGNKVSKTHRQE